MRTQRQSVVVVVPDLLRSAAGPMIRTVAIPTALTYILTLSVGATVGIWAAVAWFLALAALQARTARAVSPMTALGALSILARAGIAQATSPLVFFAQPAVMAVLFGLAMVATTRSSRPLLIRLAQEVGALPKALLENPATAAALRAISWVWAASLIVEGTAALASLSFLSLPEFLIARPVLTFAGGAIAVAVSVVLVRRATVRAGMTLSLRLRGMAVGAAEAPSPALVPAAA